MTRPLRGAAHSSLARAVTTISGARPVMVDGGDVRNLPPQAIYYANHSSHLDFVTIWAVLPPRLRARLRPIAAQDYWGHGLRRRFARNIFGAHLVDRGGGQSPRTDPGGGQSPRTDPGGGASPRGQIVGMTEVLDSGDSLLIFPEGTRGDGETLAEFHGGLYKLARHNPAIPVVPVRLGNLGRILPKGEVIPVPHLSSVTFHPPIQIADGEDRAQFLARAREILLEAG